MKRATCPVCCGVGEVVRRVGPFWRVSKCRPCDGTGRLVLTFAENGLAKARRVA